MSADLLGTILVPTPPPITDGPYIPLPMYGTSSLCMIMNQSAARPVYPERPLAPVDIHLSDQMQPIVAPFPDSRNCLGVETRSSYRLLSFAMSQPSIFVVYRLHYRVYIRLE